MSAPSFDLLAHIQRGYRFESVTPAAPLGPDEPAAPPSRYDVIAPDGRHGAGASPEEAVLNIGSVVIPVQREDYIGRLRIREDGSEVRLDVGGVREVE
jgi:hypothetical protein